MSLSLCCFILSFLEIGQLVLGKKISEGFITIYRHGSHLGHVTSIILMKLYVLVPNTLHTDLVENGQVVSEKIKF